MVSIVNESIFPCKLTSTTPVPVLPSPTPWKISNSKHFLVGFILRTYILWGKKDEQKVEQDGLPKKINNV